MDIFNKLSEADWQLQRASIKLIYGDYIECDIAFTEH